MWKNGINNLVILNDKTKRVKTTRDERSSPIPRELKFGNINVTILQYGSKLLNYLSLKLNDFQLDRYPEVCLLLHMHQKLQLLKKW